MSAEVIKADILALPGLSDKLGEVSDLAWVATLAYVNEYDMSSIGEIEVTIKYYRTLLAAHLMLTTRQAFTGAAGPMTSQSAGQVRRSFGLLAQAAGTNSWAGTQYGQLLLAVLGSSSAHGPILI